nr:MAG: hypothetical protein [Apis mellifera filamentous virus]
MVNAVNEFTLVTSASALVWSKCTSALTLYTFPAGVLVTTASDPTGSLISLTSVVSVLSVSSDSIKFPRHR